MITEQYLKQINELQSLSIKEKESLFVLISQLPDSIGKPLSERLLTFVKSLEAINRLTYEHVKDLIGDISLSTNVLKFEISCLTEELKVTKEQLDFYKNR